MTDQPFYITTPIYYVNDAPHLGHAYTTILADVLARYHRLQGRPTFFLTGTDEHGQKVQQAVRQHREAPQDYVDRLAAQWRATWDDLHIAYDDFIRTTEPRHVQVVQAMLQRLWEEGQIYRDEYEGWYCVPDERFWTEKDAVDGLCPDCGRPLEQLAETNYFFRMSDYQGWLLEHIEQHPEFIRPEYRRNEVLGFLQQPLGDLCISRPVSRLDWGIPLPFDDEYVTYVWFDALLNYVTAAGYGSQPDRFQRLWPGALHLIGKDILITHTVYWPTMLRAMGLPQPRAIFAHGWWVLEGNIKISKSRGNAVSPLELAAHYGVDAFRYFLMRDMSLGRDASFSEEAIEQRYRGDLANDLGNLVHRLTHMIARYCDGRLPPPGPSTATEKALRAHCETLPGAIFPLVEEFALNDALARIMGAVRELNRYLERTAPWQQAREGREERVATILYTAAEALRFCSLLLWPVLPARTAEIWKRFGWIPPESVGQGLAWGGLQSGSIVQKGAPLFPRKDAYAPAAG